MRGEGLEADGVQPLISSPYPYPYHALPPRTAAPGRATWGPQHQALTLGQPQPPRAPSRSVSLFARRSGTERDLGPIRRSLGNPEVNSG